MSRHLGLLLIEWSYKPFILYRNVLRYCKFSIYINRLHICLGSFQTLRQSFPVSPGEFSLSWFLRESVPRRIQAGYSTFFPGFIRFLDVHWSVLVHLYIFQPSISILTFSRKKTYVNIKNCLVIVINFLESFKHITIILYFIYDYIFHQFGLI